MKTSLIIEDSLFREAAKEAEKRHKTISETLSEWARIGREVLKKGRAKKRGDLSSFQAVDLGGNARVDLNSRRDWMDVLDS